MYVYAREGVEVERQSREIFVKDLRAEAISNDEIRIVVECGTGTYVRTLAEDIGRALGCGGAYLTALRRTVLGSFSLSHAFTLEAIENLPLNERDHCLLPIDHLVKDLRAVRLNAMAAASLRQGRKVENYSCDHSLMEEERVRLYDEENYFLGLGEVTAQGEIAPKRLLNLVSRPH